MLDTIFAFSAQCRDFLTRHRLWQGTKFAVLKCVRLSPVHTGDKKLNSTRSTLLKVDRVALAPYHTGNKVDRIGNKVERIRQHSPLLPVS